MTLLDEDFRAVGFTGAARNFPLNEAGKRAVASLNGTTVAKMPAAFCYAPNAYMRDWMEWLGLELEEGRPLFRGDRVRHPSTEGASSSSLNLPPVNERPTKAENEPS